LKPPILVGVAIGILILIVALIAPVLRSGSAKAAEEARLQAALAARLLHRHDPLLPIVGRTADLTALKGAKLETLAEQTGEKLRADNQEYARALSQMKARAAANDMPAPAVQLLTPDVGGIRRALEQAQALLKANADRLAEAVQKARQARSGAGGSVLGVPAIAGVAEYARAAGLLAEAQALRQRQQALQARLVRLGAQWAAYRANQDYHAGLDVRDILKQLRQDLAENEQHQTEERQRQQALAAEVAQREQELAQVTAALQRARDELLSLERQGFAVGNDESFQTFRARYLALSQRLRMLEEAEQLLSAGGLKNARWTSDDWETAEIQGGEVVVGLDELKGRLALAEERVRRRTAGAAALQKYMAALEQSGQAARQAQEQYAQLQSQLDAAQKELVPPVLNLAKEAADKETQALQAAREAVSAFDAAQLAADQWVSAAREVQTASDPERVNPRLKMMAGDPSAARIGASAKAEALLLTGRIQVQRFEGLRSLMNDMRLFVELRPGTEFKAEPFEEELNAARDSALDVLTKARDTYDKLIKSAPAATKWIPQGSLATVYHLLSRVNAAESATLLQEATKAIDEAVTGRAQSPYLEEYVEYRHHLRSMTGASGEQPAAETAPAGTETTQPGG